MRKIFYKTIVLSLILLNHAISQQHDLWTTFTTADGLADNSVNTIIESRDGALWFGTSGGVSRYDGIWSTFTTANGLGGDYITAIIESRHGALWVGTDRTGVSRYQDGIWTTFTKVNGLGDNYIHLIIESRDGALWFGTNGVRTYGDVARREFKRNFFGRLSRPLQTRYRVTSGFIFHQIFEADDEVGSFFPTAFLPAPLRRTRWLSNSWRKSSCRPLDTVCGSRSRSSAIF